jgi:hypothetical protein
VAASDFNSSQPVRTENKGDVVVFLSDPTTPTQQLAVDSAGRIVIKLDDGSGNLITSQANGSARALDVGINVAGVQIDPRQVRALTATDVVTSNQGTKGALSNAWPVQPTDGTNSQAYLATGEAKVAISQPLPAGTNLIGSVDIKDSSGASVTLGQKAMAASLPVTIASDQTALATKLEDGAGNNITSQVNGTQRALDVGINVAGVQVDPRAIRALTATDVVTANIKDATGAAFSSVNPLPVVISATVPGTAINDYNVSSSNVASGSSDNHDYTITATKTFLGKKFTMSSSGRARFDIQVSADGTTFVTKFTVWTTASCPTIQVDMGELAVNDSGTGSKIRIVRFNEDKSAFGLYSTISGVEQ